MNIFLDEHIEVLRCLIQHDVDFVLVGGYAVIFYGYLRTTGDLDIWLKPDNYNKEKLINALRELDFEEEDIIYIHEMDFKKHQAFSLNIVPQRIDFFNYINQVTFDLGFENRTIAEFEGLALPFIHINDLVLSKINTNRLKDKADIEELQKIIVKQNNT